MGRDDSNKGQSNNKDSLPQTPKNMKIKPSKIREEFAHEFAELRESMSRFRRKK